MSRFLQAGDACIVAQHQPALVLDYARSRDLAPRTILAGTGMDDVQAPDAQQAISPTEYLQLLANVAAGLKSPETSFMLGQQMLPGHFGALSHALMHAHSLREAIALLVRFQMQLCPLLSPRFREEGGLGVLYWTDSFGAGQQRGFLVEMHMTAMSAMCRWLSGERLPWRYCFNRTPPRYTEQHEVHLGEQLRFHCHLDAMLIDAAWLDRPWPRANAMAAAVARRTVDAANARSGQPSGQPGQRSLLCALYDYLLEHIRSAPTLEQCAIQFGVSPATLKRHLARHGSHFQAELDQVRAHVALHLFHGGRHDNDAVARHLGFHDANNFRRSFKRWTGMTPMLLRQSLDAYRLQSGDTSAII
ncbi:AraC family transcriptional regulator [Massilia pseudoviolaceinigra]|uniref:AraC family transcriptional regulator n=1 Tax=Massilia pseudoviolaceinigra TaxID=3057165 RepID=UPI002796AE0E|nr:AraC family transcriptional regulator [Massilia sp. CCM 9206]MDQ1919564.1 AraC family transcriptional regulator ligand-binding domain-containing protein [Massilia sp. CCM 9206]